MQKIALGSNTIMPAECGEKLNAHV